MARIIIAGPCLLNIVATRPWRGSLPRDHNAKALFAEFSRGEHCVVSELTAHHRTLSRRTKGVRIVPGILDFAARPKFHFRRIADFNFRRISDFERKITEFTAIFTP